MILLNPLLMANVPAAISAGSTQNMKDIASKKIQMGYVSSPISYHFDNKLFPFDTQQYTEQTAKVLFSLSPVLMTNMTRVDTQIKTYEDTKNHIVDIGHPDSAINSIFQKLWSEKGWTKQDFKKVTELRGIIRARSLCQGKIDIYSFITYHPSESLEKDVRRCQTRFVPFEEILSTK